MRAPGPRFESTCSSDGPVLSRVARNRDKSFERPPGVRYVGLPMLREGGHQTRKDYFFWCAG